MNDCLSQIAITLLAIILCTLAAHANVLVYKGALNAFDVGGGTQGKRANQIYTILDLTTGEAAIIVCSKFAGVRYYAVEKYSDVLLNEFQAARGKTMTIFHLAQTDFDEFGNQTFTTFFLRGTNSTVEVAVQTTAEFPKTVKGVARLTGVDEFGTPFFSEQSLSLTYDRDSTFVSNNFGHTFQQTVNALTNVLEAKGYQNAGTTK